MANQDKSQAASRSGGRNNVRIVLVVVLILMIIALYHDRFRARPQLEAAYERISKKNDEVVGSSEKVKMTNEDIKKLVGFGPSYTQPDPQDDSLTMEVYTWRRGLPWMTYKLFAVYQDQNGKLRFLRHHKYALPEKEEAPPSKPPSGKDTVVDVKGGAGGSKGGGRKGGLDFAKLDANVDGRLTAEELRGLPEAFRDRLLQSADTDHDGIITKEEFDKRPRGGGSGRRKGEGAGQQPPAGGASPEKSAKPAEQKPAEKPQ